MTALIENSKGDVAIGAANVLAILMEGTSDDNTGGGATSSDDPDTSLPGIDIDPNASQTAPILMESTSDDNTGGGGKRRTDHAQNKPVPVAVDIIWDRLMETGDGVLYALGRGSVWIDRENRSVEQAILARVDESGDLLWQLPIYGLPNISIDWLTVDDWGNINVAGRFEGGGFVAQVQEDGTVLWHRTLLGIGAVHALLTFDNGTSAVRGRLGVGLKDLLEEHTFEVVFDESGQVLSIIQD